MRRYLRTIKERITADKEDAAMKSYIFRLVIEEDAFEDGRKAYHAHCPALKGCHTWGHTYEEALANIKEAVELYVEDLREAGEPVPLDPQQGAIEWPTPSVAVNV
jgi:predicted RNase H-like HicB family nuclease